MATKYLYVSYQFDSKRFGQYVRDARIRAELTQVELGQILNVDGSYISSIECGKALPTISTYVSVCNALDINPAICWTTSL